jgi:SAM-dependent methyltransferase
MNATSAAAARGQTTAPADLTAVKTRQQGAWASGDYAVVGTTLQIVGEQLCEALDLRPGQRVLDVAAGNGNVTLAAARRWCRVTSTDFVPSLLERARERAAAERLEVEFQQADAEALPFADDSFDAVVSTFGVMFTPAVQTNAIGMSYGALFTLVIVLARGIPFDFVWTAPYLGSLVYLAVFASVIGFGSYLTLVQRIGADRAAYSGVLFPIVALGVSTFLENYQWTAPAVVGVLLVLTGNLLALARRRPAPPLATSPLPAAGGSGN